MKTVLIEINQVLWDMSKYPGYQSGENHHKLMTFCSYEEIIAAILVVRKVNTIWVNKERDSVLIATVPDDFDCEEMLQLTGVFSLSQEPIKKQPLVLFCQEIPYEIERKYWRKYLGETDDKKETIALGFTRAHRWKIRFCEEAIPEKFNYRTSQPIF